MGEAKLDTGGRTKPLLTVDQQIAHLRSKGVTFDVCDEEEATDFLECGNNYLRTASYRKLYDVRAEGPHAGEYANLDFADLKNLSSLDRQLREAFLAMAIDIEHFSRMKVLRLAEEHGEDGYAIVRNFLASLNHAGRNAIQGGLEHRAREGEAHDTYVGDLIAHHRDDMSLWVLLEVLGFGTFLTLYKFCAERWADEEMLQEHYVLKSVKALRNATAHNHCIVNGFLQASDTVGYQTNQLITDALNAAGMPRTKSRRAKLANLRMAQIAATLYAFSAFCTRPSTAARAAARLTALRAAYEANLDRYRMNSSLVSFFDFLWRLVDIWMPERA